MATSVAVLPDGAMSPAGGDGRSPTDIQMPSAVPVGLLLDIRETHRQRQDILRAELRLTNQIEAIHRRLTGKTKAERAAGQVDGATQDRSARRDSDTPEGEGDQARLAIRTPTVPLPPPAELAAGPLINARELLRHSRKPLEKQLEKMARELPIWEAWAKQQRGFGPLSLAQIVGECGDLSDYGNPAKVWKRMGLAVINGQRQRRVTDPEQAIAHGYSPQRRAIMFVISENLVKLNQEGPYRTCYLARKEVEREKAPELPPIAHHKRAMRYMVKRLLRDLWRAW